MNVVGKVGSLISQGVYSVATPFHPFGGAVDVIVVEQQDGTYRSTPWYVRFGKFQGVLKGAEKIVTISVNGVESNFHMYLDNSGKAYFTREVDDQEMSDSKTFESNQGEDASITGDDPQNSFDENESRIQDEQASPEGSVGSSSFNSYHYGSLDDVEDLVKQSDSPNSEMVLVSIDGHVLTAPISSNEATMENVQLNTPQFHLGPGEGSGGEFAGSGDVWEPGLFGDLDISTEKDIYPLRDQPDCPKDCREAAVDDEEARSVGNCEVESENVSAGLSREETFKSCLDLMSQVENGDSEETPGLSSLSEEKVEEMEISTISNLGNDLSLSLENEVEDLKHNASVDIRQGDDKPNLHVIVQEVDLIKSTETETTRIETESRELLVRSETNDKENLRSTLESSAIEGELNQADIPTLPKQASGLGFEISLCGNLLRPHMGRDSAEEAFEAYRISEEEFASSGPSIMKNTNLVVRVEDKYLPWAKIQHVVLGKAVFGPNFSAELKDAIPVENDETANGVSPSVSRRWKLWPIPFRISRSSFQHSGSKSSNEDIFLDSESVLQSPTAEQAQSTKSQSPRKQFVRTNIPTNEQIASLNLKEGQNMVAFSFSTRVLGRQQVDAHIYLWKWNAQIVISDVDGTITKSDVLGQFMPLVGKDWTQSGVARLFSAIKENGYQLLFLSARAIVQAYLTRSFLLNLKQDGKALPSGPVVISPDGLFPSLYREVVRRAPHEFKIACLQDIRALFPSDYNPFYAGFGNRDTDELSYRKIGIPKGKIFIINPKGEVAINHCVDVKSYTSLHTLVNDMFPPTSMVEQEDYNSWNYWKMPLPDIDL